MGVCFGTKKDKSLKERSQLRSAMQSNISKMTINTSNTNFYIDIDPLESLSWYSIEQLFNLVSFHRNDFTTSDIILWDTRKGAKENIFKRLRQINYQPFELNEQHKLANLRRYISGKKILLLVDQGDLKLNALAAINELSMLEIHNRFLVFGSDLASDYCRSLVNVLDRACLNSLPYILFSRFDCSSFRSLFIAYDKEEKFEFFKGMVRVRDEFDFVGFRTAGDITSRSGVESMGGLLNRLARETCDVLIRVSREVEDSALIMIVTLLVWAVKKCREEFIVNIFQDNLLFGSRVCEIAKSELFSKLLKDLNKAYNQTNKL